LAVTDGTSGTLSRKAAQTDSTPAKGLPIEKVL
jgi:hypothetical protein